MKQVLKTAIVEAVECASTEVRTNLAKSPSETLNHEALARCAMYMSFRQQGLPVHVEAAYPKKHQKCDLRVLFGDGDEAWIEVKTAWHVAGWNNKPAEQRDRCRKDLVKLRHAPQGTSRVFALFGFFGDEKAGVSGSVFSAIHGLLEKSEQIHDSGTQPFQWGDVRTMRAWAWVV